jgi:hypothetical protein
MPPLFSGEVEEDAAGNTKALDNWLTWLAKDDRSRTVGDQGRGEE